jgi:hypothetical protein
MSINLSRSPFIITIDVTNQTSTRIELFLWTTGVQPASPQYTLSKKIPASNNISTSYNISPYVKEYYNFGKWDNDAATLFNNAISTDYIVNYTVEKFKTIAGSETSAGTVTGQFMNGYSEYMEGQNRVMQNVLLNQGTYLYNYDADIPSSQGNALAGSFDAQMDTGEKIRYTNLSTAATQEFTAASDAVLSFGRVYTGWNSVGNKVEMLNTSSNVIWTSTFKPKCEPKYKPVIIDFVNKYGSWSRIYFLKANNRNINVKSDQYKLNPQSLPFSPTQDGGQIHEFNKTGNESIKLNTGWVNDGYAEYLQQLLLSENVTLLDYDYNQSYNPVNVQTKSLKKQTGLNDGTMNYELTFDFAYDLINNVV